jgi:hypothetical protein
MMGATRLADGTWVRSLWRSEDQPHVLVSLRRADGSVIDRQLPNCELLPFKDQLLAYCEGEKPAFRSIYPEQRALAAPPQPLLWPVVDPVDGLLFAERKDWRACDTGRCPLLRFDGTKWQDWPHLSEELGAQRIRLRAARHGRLLFCGDTCLVRSATDPSDPGIDLGKYTKAYRDSVPSAALLDDEVILVAKQPGDDGKATLLHIVFTARGLAVTRGYEVPNYIENLAFADAEHGVAIFSNYVCYTMHGGKSWLYEYSVGSVGASACWSEGCTVGNSLLLTRAPLREPVILGEYNPNDEGPSNCSSSSDTEACSGNKKDENDSFEPPPDTKIRKPPDSFPWYDCITQRPVKGPADSGVVTGGYITVTPGTRALGWRGSDKNGTFKVQTPFVMPEPKPEPDPYLRMGHGYEFDFTMPPLVTRHFAVLAFLLPKANKRRLSS